MAKPKALKVATTNEPGYHRDRGDGAAMGLYLQVTEKAGGEGVSKSWIYRYVSPTTGRSRWMGLGSADIVSLAEAREEARNARKAARQFGIDPIEEREAKLTQKKLEAARTLTWGECVDQFLEAHRDTWRNAKHRAQWENTLKEDAKLLTPLPVAEIGTALVLKVLQPIWRTKTETAKRLRGRIERVLAFATVREYRKGENPARWGGHLKEILPAPSKVRKVKHHKALPYAELPAFMADLRGRDVVSAKALEVTILCAMRTNEAIGAEWSEIDLAAKVWQVPAERMKGHRHHRIPLSDRVIEVLQSLPREGNYVFPGAKKNMPLSNMAMLELVRGAIGNGYTVHGFRSAFKDWARERTGFPNEVSEAALAHINGDKVEAAYARGDLFDKRRQLMNKWAGYCAEKPVEKPKASGDNVTPIRARG